MKKERDDSYSHVLKYTGLFGGVHGLSMLFGLVRNKIVVELLGPAGLGLVTLFNTAVNFISQATHLGISFSAVKRVSELFEQGDEARIAHFVKVVRGWSLLTALLGMLVCMVGAPLLSTYTFSQGDHTLQFVMLAPAVAMIAISGGETAILKGARQLNSLAVIQLCCIVLALLVSVPVYYYFGKGGIVPVIVLLALTTLLVTARFSYRLYPLRLSGVRGILGEGMSMVRLGVAFVLAGIFTAGGDMFVRSYLNVRGDLDVVGLYNAGYQLSVVYAGMVFSAMETDYFPRVSAVANDRAQMTLTVNRQIEVSFLLISPMLSVLLLTLPLLVPLLFNSQFLVMVPMARVTAFSMYLKALSLPIAYMMLARGDSLAFLVTEALYAIYMSLLIIIGYDHMGLFGTGVALVVSHLLELVVVYAYTRWRYGYRGSVAVGRMVLLQLPLGIAIYVLSLLATDGLYWTLGSLLCAASIAISLMILHRKTALWNALATKVKAKLGRHA